VSQTPLEEVRWTWLCPEEDCGAKTTTPAKAEAPTCVAHGVEMVRVCEVCEENIEGRRADAVTCGAPCRAEKSRSAEGTGSGGQAHTGARTPRRRRPRKDRGSRVYYLPDELDAATDVLLERIGEMAADGAGASPPASPPEPLVRAAEKARAARDRLNGRSTPRGPRRAASSRGGRRP
jgi:hypothetical protein